MAKPGNPLQRDYVKYESEPSPDYMIREVLEQSLPGAPNISALEPEPPAEPAPLLATGQVAHNFSLGHCRFHTEGEGTPQARLSRGLTHPRQNGEASVSRERQSHRGEDEPPMRLSRGKTEPMHNNTDRRHHHSPPPLHSPSLSRKSGRDLGRKSAQDLARSLSPMPRRKESPAKESPASGRRNKYSSNRSASPVHLRDGPDSPPAARSSEDHRQRFGELLQQLGQEYEESILCVEEELRSGLVRSASRALKRSASHGLTRSGLTRSGSSSWLGNGKQEDFKPTSSLRGPVKQEDFKPTSSVRGNTKQEDFKPTSSVRGNTKQDDFKPVSSLRAMKVEEFKPNSNSRKGTLTEPEHPLLHNGSTANGTCGDMEELTRRVSVIFVKAVNLRNADISWLGLKSDPYACCHWSSDEHKNWRTPTMKNNLNPIWEQTIDIGACRFDEELIFTVWDDDNGFTKDDLLGRASLPAYLFCTSGFEGNLPLKDAKDVQHGELHVKITIHEPEILQHQRKLLSSRQASGNLDRESFHSLATQDLEKHTILHWENLVKCMLECVSCEMRWPRPVWRSTGKLHSRLVAKQCTGRVTEVVQLARGQSAVSFMRPSIRRTNFLDIQALKPAEWTAINPHSKKRIAWALVGMMFMVYDVIMIPMQVFVLPQEAVFDFMMWSSQIFWTLDIVMNFFTGVYVGSQLQTDLCCVAKKYICTWFLFDFSVTVITYVPLTNATSETESAISRSVQTMRLFRLTRLARLCKFGSLLNETLEVINSPGLLLTIQMVKHNIFLIVWNHIVACLWYFIGDVDDGWIYNQGVSGKVFSYRYLTSLHWTLAQYQGNTDISPTTATERAYAVIFLQIAMIILALFVSRLTNMMRQMQELMHEKSSRQRSVCAYLAENQISAALSVRVKKYVDWQRRFERRRKEDEEVLLILPTPILMDLLEEVRGPVLQVHPFFNIFCSEFTRISRRLCHEAVYELTPAPGETVFAPGDACNEMFFVRSGQLRYVAKPRAVISKVQRHHRSNIDYLDDAHDFECLSFGSKQNRSVESHVDNAERVGTGFWISEAVLWCEWEHCGDLVGLDDNILLCLAHQQFAEIVIAQSSAVVTASLYARRFVAAFDRFGYTFTDLIDHNVLFDDPDPYRPSDATDMTASRLGSIMSADSNFIRPAEWLPPVVKVFDNAAKAMNNKLSRLGSVLLGKQDLNHLHPIVSQSKAQKRPSAASAISETSEFK